MLEITEILLVLQDRDRTIVQGRAEVVGLEIERVSVNERSATAEAAQADAEQAGKELEVKKNALEMEAAGEQTKIITYSKQQLETKDNTQYRALVKQIDDCKKNISNFETDELMVLEEMDANAETQRLSKSNLDAANQDQATALSEIDERETNLKKQIDDTIALRAETAAQIDEDTLARYDRLLKKGRANIVVGVEHSACGGCHMKLPTADVAHLKSSQEVNYCPNCSCIIYYTRSMDLTVEKA
jgi:uncharacterized protein